MSKQTHSELISNYPIVDEHRLHHVRYPISKDGKWRAADVVENGYIDPFASPVKVDFDSEQECQKACTIHNEYIGMNSDQVDGIILWSMGMINAES